MAHGNIQSFRGSDLAQSTARNEGEISATEEASYN